MAGEVCPGQSAVSALKRHQGVLLQADSWEEKAVKGQQVKAPGSGGPEEEGRAAGWDGQARWGELRPKVQARPERRRVSPPACTVLLSVGRRVRAVRVPVPCAVT